MVRKALVISVDILDVAPTILGGMGIEASGNMEGEVIE